MVFGPDKLIWVLTGESLEKPKPKIPEIQVPLDTPILQVGYDGVSSQECQWLIGMVSTIPLERRESFKTIADIFMETYSKPRKGNKKGEKRKE